MAPSCTFARTMVAVSLLLLPPDFSRATPAVQRRQMQSDPAQECAGDWATCTVACEMVPDNPYGYVARTCTPRANAVAIPATDCLEEEDDCGCPPGNYYGLTCDACAPGRFDHDMDTSTLCVECPYGKYSSGVADTTNNPVTPGAIECTLCEPGKYAGVNGTSVCGDCAAGEHAGKGAKRCAPTYTSVDEDFTYATQNFLCADDVNDGGVAVATVFLPQGYRVGCDGDENETSSANENCANEIVCEYPPDGGSIPETGVRTILFEVIRLKLAHI